MNVRTPEQILLDLSGLLRDFDGREYSGDIGPQTRFFADLGMVSIDAVLLAERVEQMYGRKLPFHLFLSEIGKDGVRDIELGELAAFLHRQLGAGGEV